MNISRLRNDRGFTLIELMMVVVIIGVLAAIAMPKFTNASSSAKEAEATPILKQVYTLQERHRQQHGAYADRFATLEGSAEPVHSAKYYEFLIDSDAASFHVCAKPKTASGLRSFQIDQSQALTELPNAAACTGNST